MRAPIALLILAKNEEKWIGSCIRPVRPHASEIIVMDTGSSDRTIEVARSLGARVIKNRFDGDFAKARNRLIDEAKQPWILFLDADEVLSTSDARLVAGGVRTASVDAFDLEIRHYTDEYNLLNDWTPCAGEYPKEERLSGKCGFYRYARPLLFKRHPKIRYEYPIHESILPALKKGRRRVARLPIAVHHFEFDRGMRHHRRKHRKYLGMELRLLESMPADSPCYPMMLQSAVADIVSTGGDLLQASRYCDALISRRPRDERYRMLKARVAMLQGSFDTAHEELRTSIAIKETPDNLCLAGWSQMEAGDVQAAAAFLDRAIALRPSHVVSLNLRGILLANEGNLDAALMLFARTLKIHPRYAECRANRATVLLAQGRKAKALDDLRQVQELTTDGDLLRRTRLLIHRTNSASDAVLR